MRSIRDARQYGSIKYNVNLFYWASGDQLYNDCLKGGTQANCPTYKPHL
jgi:hypothetical protein